MTSSELRSALEALTLSQVKLSQVIGLDPRTVRRWVLGETPIPSPACKLVRLMVTGVVSPEHVERI